MWYQLQIEQCEHDKVEELSDRLEETNALSVTLTDKNDDPVLEPAPGTTPLWPDVVIHALYAEEQEANQALTNVRSEYPHLSFSIHSLAEQDWERVWMDDFKPQRFGKRLWVCPSWAEPPEPEAVNLILDPGLAFGTGTHPTTSLCLQWLDSANLTGKTVIDYGCGSGILALAALKLGAQTVHAVDIDEQALQATQNNALSNKINLKQLEVGFPDALKTPVDLIIANILLTPLINLRTRFKELLVKDGFLVVSGILKEQESMLINEYLPDFQYQESIVLDGWSLVVLT